MVKTIISALIWYTSIVYMIWTTVKLVILISSPVWITYLIRRYKRIEREKKSKKAELSDNVVTASDNKVEDLIPPETDQKDDNDDNKSLKDKYKL